MEYKEAYVMCRKLESEKKEKETQSEFLYLKKVLRAQLLRQERR